MASSLTLHAWTSPHAKKRRAEKHESEAERFANLGLHKCAVLSLQKAWKIYLELSDLKSIGRVTDRLSSLD